MSTLLLVSMKLDSNQAYVVVLSLLQEISSVWLFCVLDNTLLAGVAASWWLAGMQAFVLDLVHTC